MLKSGAKLSVPLAEIGKLLEPNQGDAGKRSKGRVEIREAAGRDSEITTVINNRGAVDREILDNRVGLRRSRQDSSR
jgi:hypothetical protein